MGCYYDRWNDKNREAFKQGEKDAFYGYRSHRHDFDSWKENGCAYNDGYEEERRRIEEREKEERREQERYERMREERRREEEYQRQLEEEAYWEQLEQECQQEDSPDSTDR
jgi:predicted acyl esterase